MLLYLVESASLLFPHTHTNTHTYIINKHSFNLDQSKRNTNLKEIKNSTTKKELTTPENVSPGEH